MFLERTVIGSFWAIFSSSTGTLILRNSSRVRKPPPTRTYGHKELTEDLVAFDLYEDSLGSELVHSFSFSDEELGQLVRIIGCVDELSDLSVDDIITNSNIYCTLVLQLQDQLL